MLRRFSVNFALLSMLLDGLLVALSLWLATALRPQLSRFPGIELVSSPVATPAPLYVIFPLIWILIYSALSIYDGRKYIRVVDEFAALSLAMLIASVSAAGVLYFSYRQVSRALVLFFIVLVYILGLLWRAFVRLYFRTQNNFPDRLRRVLVVGAGSLGQRVREQMLDSELPNLEFIGFTDHGGQLKTKPLSLLGTNDGIDAIVQDHKISDVVIALPHSEYHQMSDIVQKLERVPVQVWVALGFFDLALYKTAIEDFAGIPMLDLRASAIDDYQRMMKRTFDFSIGLAALIPALPLMAFSALVIYVEGGSPILFRQQRVGENGRLFEMLKFRTMVRNAEQLKSQVEKRDADGNILHKSKEDPRVTRVGRFLRRFSLDELPQIFNVLRGDMSLVGPRPELPYLVEKYQPWQRKRFAIPPGITGWWQVSGRSDKPMHLHTEDDMYYIQNYSIFLDIQILLRTVWVVLMGKGSY
ncbi:MAG: sugar transferase [Anaerolineales bacterium]|nr:MAG: sugar transferase [Anaerolineales bacterium]